MTPVTGKNQHRLMSMSWRQRAKVRGQVLDHPSWPAAAAVRSEIQQLQQQQQLGMAG